MQTGRNITLKYLVIGDSGVGKTSMLVRYCEDCFQTDYLSTIGVDFKIKRIEQDGNSITLNIWDTAGQQRFRNITKSFYKGAHGIVVAYSITDPISFEHIGNWIQQIKQSGNAQTNMILVASKCDMQDERKVTKSQGEQLAEKYKMTFLQTSAKKDLNISKAFELLTRDASARILKQYQPQQNPQILTTQKKKLKNTQCCA